MAQIEGIRIVNFRGLKDITFGKLWNTPKNKPLSPLTVVIGKNGVGKSALFDVFGFLADCLKYGVYDACEMNDRGGFDSIRSYGVQGNLEFEIYYRENKKSRPITYELAIANDKKGLPYVKRECLRQRREKQNRGLPYSFLILEEGKGHVWSGFKYGVREIEEGKLEIERIEKEGSLTVKMSDSRKLGITTLGSLVEHPRISKFREFISGWYISYFSPVSARTISNNGFQKHLNKTGENLSNVVQYMYKNHQDRFRDILSKIAERIPGIEKIVPYREEISNNLYLLFYQTGIEKPFNQRQMSDGTLKMFAYLLLLEDPSPPPFLCIEEPENGLYHKLLEILACEFREHANKKGYKSQVFITTHQPYFINALSPEEVWILEKDKDGFSTIKRVSENDLVANLVEQELPLGDLWYSDYLDEK